MLSQRAWKEVFKQGNRTISIFYEKKKCIFIDLSTLESRGKEASGFKMLCTIQ